MNIPSPEALAAIDDKTLASHYIEVSLRQYALDAEILRRLADPKGNAVIEAALSPRIRELQPSERQVSDRRSTFAELQLRTMFRRPVNVRASFEEVTGDEGQTYRNWTVDLEIGRDCLLLQGCGDHDNYDNDWSDPHPALVQAGHVLTDLDGALVEAALRSEEPTEAQAQALTELYSTLDTARDLAIVLGECSGCDIELTVMPVTFQLGPALPTVMAP